MFRDSQRKKVYRAEREALWGKPFDRKFADLDEVKQYANRIITSKWTLSHFENAQAGITVKDGRGRRRAYGSYWEHEISLPVWSRTLSILCHEMSHVLTRERPAHCPEFAANFLALVRHFMGHEAYAALKASFKAHHVRTRRKGHRAPLTEEQKAILRERLAAARTMPLKRREN